MPIKEELPCEILWKNPDGKFVSGFKAYYEGAIGPFYVYKNGFAIMCDLLEDE